MNRFPTTLIKFGPRKHIESLVQGKVFAKP